MDEFDTFYQHLDSKELLDRHGKKLVADARAIFAKSPDARLTGLIVCSDSRDGGPLRQVLAQATGRQVPEGLLVGLFPRPMVEGILTKMVGTEPWREEPWQIQQVLPVVVSTRDGFRFGFFPLGERQPGAEGAG